METLDLARKAVEWLDAKKAHNIEVIRIDEISSVADYFVICSATSSTQVKALSDEVEMKFKEQGREPLRIDGFQSGSWIVLDYGSVLIHVMQSNMREFYKLERIWADGEHLDISDIVKPDAPAL